MQQSVFILLALITGLIAGALLMWVALRTRAKDSAEGARKESQVELATLRTKLESSDDQRSRLTTELSETRVAKTNAETELGRIRMQLADRNQALEGETKRRTEQDAILKVEQQKSEVLQQQLGSQRERVATLDEQASRIPQLVQSLDAALQETTYSRKQLAEISAKHDVSAKMVEMQSQRIGQLEGERDALNTELGNLRIAKAEADSQLIQVQAQLADRNHGLEEAANRRIEQEALFMAERQKNESLQEQFGMSAQRTATLEEQAAQHPKLVQVRDDLERRREELDRECAQLRVQLAESQIKLDVEQRQSAEKVRLLLEAREELANQFKALANEILEEKSKRFIEQNQTNLATLLEPLRTRLQEFQGKVEEVYVREGKDRSALAEQVRQLMQLNQQLSADANNLSKALRSESKTQGGWGELLLERVLQASGLQEGIHYAAQVSENRTDGSRAQPDVVIHLPDSKHLVVDAKVSLTAYSEYTEATVEDAKSEAIKRHLNSVRSHITGLANRNYQELYQLKSLDFVVMFVPIEPAFSLAILNDETLWLDAWKQNVLLVSPSTLLFVVRIVDHLWRQEQQTRNVQDIAKRGAELYDKLSNFVEDLEAVGKRLDQAKVSFDEAFKKLSTGRGNVIRQAELLKTLGVKPTKSLPSRLVELNGDEDAPAEGTSFASESDGDTADRHGVSQALSPLDGGDV